MKDDQPYAEASFQRMLEKIHQQFPEMTLQQRVHTCNLVSNYLRKLKMDIYGVSLSRSPHARQGYDHHFVLQSGAHKVYGRVIVD